MNVTRRSCPDCGRPLRSSRALRCGRCRARRRRDLTARRVWNLRARATQGEPPGLPTPPPAPSPVSAAPEPVAESPWVDAEGRPISPERVLELLRDPANRPPAGSPEWRQLKGHLEDYTETLDERGDPLAESFFRLLAEFFQDPTEEVPSVPAPAPAASAVQGRRLEFPVSTLNEGDLIPFVQDPTWDPASHRAFISELARRDALNAISPPNREVIRDLLVWYGRSGPKS